MNIDPNVDAQLPRPGLYGERRVRSPIDPNVQQRLKNYLVRMRNLQDVYYDQTIDYGGYERRAFQAALQIAERWLHNENQANIEIDGTPVHVTADAKNIFKGVKTLVWVEDVTGTKFFYTIDSLKEINLQGIQNKIAGIERLGEEYAGNVKEDISHNPNFGIPQKIGMKFFKRNAQGAFRNAQAGNATEFGTFSFPGQHRRRHAGAFWPFVATIPCCMEKIGVFNEIKKENYKNSCFIEACIHSGVFDLQELDHMKFTILTRKFPRDMIKDIAKDVECNFIVQYVDETKPKGKQMVQKLNTIDTLKKDYGRTVELYLYKEHYFLNCNIPMTQYYVEHYEELLNQFPEIPIDEMMMMNKPDHGRIRYSKTGTNSMTLIRKMEECGRFKPIEQEEDDIIRTTEYDKVKTEYTNLEYSTKLCTRKIDNKKRTKDFKYVFYADFESDINVNPHRAYLCVCIGNENGKLCRRVFKGIWCAKQFLEWLPSDSLVYFHNLKYDASFIMNAAPGKFKIRITERTGTILQLQFFNPVTNTNITFRNSYSIITAPLSKFGEMFNLKVEKDVCPYHVYSRENISKRFVTLKECCECLKNEREEQGKAFEDDIKQFISNCERLNLIVEGSKGKSIDIIEYAEYYCTQDCKVLMQGLNAFDRDLRQLFKDNNEDFCGVDNYVSVSAIGYHFAVIYGCLEGCYQLAGKPQDFMSRCVSGGRTMTAKNEKIIVEKNLQDFDAVSLYPSAMKAMPGIPKGIPKVLSEADCKNKAFLSKDAYYIEINITKLESKNNRPYRFPLVFKKIDGIKTFVNEPVDHFYVDKRGLEDLIEFYDIEYEVLRGYYFDEGFNPKINEFIQKLFDLRAKYKKEKNPLQQTIKLLLNSIYGKSILKPVKTEKKVVNPKNFEDYVIRNYNFIQEITVVDGKNIYSKEIKPINKHFNCPQFGISVLSWSKHIMNKVMCLADQLGIDVYYQDTDSLHIEEADVPKLASAYKEKYGAELIGSQLGQFHCDFDPIKPGVPVHSKKLIALGKKSYLDVLEDDEGNQAYHIRMKGIPQPVLKRECMKNDWTLEDLYMYLYDGNTIKFNLLEGCNCFRKNKTYEMITPDVFFRTVRF